ncbi:MAG: ECF-type sigma factor [Gemmatimonadota bacterium]|nr:ECF-type sigma factor [Gemmatimonadota bacterium]
MATAKRDAGVDELFSLAYEELRRLAAAVRRDDPAATLSPTGLVNEAWLKLAATPGLRPASRLHLKRIAARAMRQVLVEAARRRRAAKRGGERAAFVALDEVEDRTIAVGTAAMAGDSAAGAVVSAEEVLSLDAALARLAALSPRQAEVVELRFFGGWSVAETARLVGISEATVLRDWRAARAWLARAMGAGE